MKPRTPFPGLLLLTMVLGFSSSAPGQQTGDGKGPYVEVPRENALLLVAAQPDCPLQFENPKLLIGIEGRPLALEGNIRNRGIKPISSFSFALWNSLGGGWVDSWPRKTTKDVLGAGQALPLATEPANEIVPAIAELRQKLKLQGPMKVILVVVVVQVKFADGTSYSDEATFKALQDYLDSIATK